LESSNLLLAITGCRQSSLAYNPLILLDKATAALIKKFGLFKICPLPDDRWPLLPEQMGTSADVHMYIMYNNNNNNIGRTSL
jgi:hypothetical protein